MNSKELQRAIQDLNKKRVAKEKTIMENLNGFRKYFDPVFYVKNTLPTAIPISIKVDNLLNNTISDSTYAINDKIIAYTNDSFLLRSGTSVVTNMITKTVHTNRNKIKAISLAIIKNILN